MKKKQFERNCTQHDCLKTARLRTQASLTLELIAVFEISSGEGSLLTNNCAEIAQTKIHDVPRPLKLNGFRDRPHIEFNRKSRFVAHSLTNRSPRDVQGTSDWLKHSDPFLGR